MRNAWPAAVVSLAAAILSLPVLLYGFPVMGHDGRQHLLWTLLFSSQFWAGDWYPRWLMDLYHGFGGPTFFVYGPMPYFLTSLLGPIARLFPGKPPGSIELGISAVLALECSGIFAYLWLWRMAAAPAAMAGAVLYLLAPYHVTVDLYMRAALPELWAFAWMPLILYFTEGVARRRRGAWAGLAVSYGLLISTHLLTTLMFSPLPVAYSMALAARGQRLRDAARVCGGLLLGIGLSAIYLFPALAHKRYVSPARFLADPVFQWHRNFPPLDGRLFEVAGSWPSFLQFIAVVWIWSALVTLVLAAMVWSAGSFWLGVAAVSLFMMTPASGMIWRGLPLLENLQFPWRFQTVATVAVAALTALGLSGPWTRMRRIAAAGLCGLALLAASVFARMARIVSYQDHARGWSINYSAESLLPAWGSPGAREIAMELVRFESGAGTARVERWAPRDIRVHLSCASASQVLFHQFYYPGWRTEPELPVDASDTGQVRVSTPAGEYDLRLWLDGGPMEWIGKWVSALSLAVLLLLSSEGVLSRRANKETTAARGG